MRIRADRFFISLLFIVIYIAGLDNGKGHAEATDAAGNKSGQSEERSEFLREEGVLLKQNEFQIDIGTYYSTDTRLILIESETEDVFLSKLIRSSVNIPLTVRCGLSNDLQLFITVPFTQQKLDVRADVGSQNVSESGIGDITSGLRYQLYRERGVIPDMVFGFAAKARNGKDPYSESPNAIPLGSGHYHLIADLVAIKSLDPAIFFLQVGYEYTIKRNVHGQEVDPWDPIIYNFGTGFALNDQITLSTRVNGRINGQTLIGGMSDGFGQNSINIEFGTSILLREGMSIFPSVVIGLTEEAPDVTIGLSLTSQFNIFKRFKRKEVI